MAGRLGDWEIKNWTDKDKKLARLFNTVCNVKAEDAMDFSGISSRRLLTMRNMQLIEEKVDKCGNRYYHTTSKGREVFEEQSGVRGYASNSYIHDKALYDVYVSRNEEEQLSWRTEREQIHYIRDHAIDIGESSVSDGSYVDSTTGETVYVEIITSDYSDGHKAAKIEYVEIMGGIYDPHHI